MKWIEKDHDFLGIGLGIVFPIVVKALLMMLAEREIMKLSDSFGFILCVGSCLIPFYFYLNRHMYRTVRGVVIMCILWAIVYFITYSLGGNETA